MTEDQVCDYAKDTLGLEDTPDARSGAGQLTSFVELGFPGELGRPDGWHLPTNTNDVALVLEAKRSGVNISSPKCVNELAKNMAVVRKRYAKVVGILYNGDDIAVYKDGALVQTQPTLQNKEYYFSLYQTGKIDKGKIYSLTKRINDALHIDFKVKKLYHRMIFTACALAAERYGASLSRLKGVGWNTFHAHIVSTLQASLEDPSLKNPKLKLLIDEYGKIQIPFSNQKALDELIDCIVEISTNINSDFWNGEDVMAIFFNEFSRYKGKSEQGQVFTPDHITSLMYRLIGVGKDDVVLDAACGSGAFLVKAMCNMIREAGGPSTDKARHIKDEQLFGIENSPDIYALACANMLIHKDGKTNLALLDSRTPEAAAWIRSKNVTKVLMNPPFETKYGCLDIVRNVLDSVPQHTLCAFILPDKKLEKTRAKGWKIVKAHRLLKIVKLPENLFFGISRATSIFIFEAGVPQGGTKIFACEIADDGLESVKNQGRHDIRNLWPELEEYWSGAVYRMNDDRFGTTQWLDPERHLSYQRSEKPFSIAEADFRRKAMGYLMFRDGIDADAVSEKIADAVMYGEGSNAVPAMAGALQCWPQSGQTNVDTSTWKGYKVGSLFKELKLRIKNPDFKKRTDLSEERTETHTLPLINAKHGNNGIMFWGKPADFESEGMTLDIVKNGAIATGDVYAQPQTTGVLWDAYLVKPVEDSARTAETLLFLSAVLQKAIKDRFSYDDKCTWRQVRETTLKLPSVNGAPDWKSMEGYMAGVIASAETVLAKIKAFMQA